MSCKHLIHTFVRTRRNTITSENNIFPELQCISYMTWPNFENIWSQYHSFPHISSHDVDFYWNENGFRNMNRIFLLTWTLTNCVYSVAWNKSTRSSLSCFKIDLTTWYRHHHGKDYMLSNEKFPFSTLNTSQHTSHYTMFLITISLAYSNLWAANVNTLSQF